ncbi:hypothetical protein RVIR1_00840 [Candidatus Rickettsiella viridis]|uniref:Uncharacterized protein n=1 Tax=Candidatus Rickettsiella viridis TaxID=676208 RepID=A0A2Z5USR4_9COXI|nr:hypothetical protein [Candidatus Rickettsiella viridis]BBB14626.1 hypothetical protein RVIR1_00840 [Candidatus Rickettsiella viridis]
MIEIQNGVIKNIKALCPDGQRYLEKIENTLNLSKRNGSFDLGFVYTYSESDSSTWGSVKSTLPNKDDFKKLFPSIQKIDRSDRQEKKIPEIVEIIKKDILNTLIALEKNHANKYNAYHKFLVWIAHISKRVSGLLIFGVTTIAIAAVAAAIIFGIGTFAPTAASIVKFISTNAALVASTIVATISLTGISHVISRYILKKRNEALPTVVTTKENCDTITKVLAAGKQEKISRPPTNDLGTLKAPVPSAPYSPGCNDEPANTGPDIKDAFSRAPSR